MKTITVTHANTGNKAEIVKSQIFAWTYNDKFKCIVIYSNGGAIFPIRETAEELSNILLKEI